MQIFVKKIILITNYGFFVYWAYLYTNREQVFFFEDRRHLPEMTMKQRFSVTEKICFHSVIITYNLIVRG